MGVEDSGFRTEPTVESGNTTTKSKEEYLTIAEQQEWVKKVNGRIKDLIDRIKNNETQIVYLNNTPYELMGSEEEVKETLKALWGDKSRCEIMGNAEFLTINGKAYGRPIDQIISKEDQGEFLDPEYKDQILEIKVPEQRYFNSFEI